MDGLFTPAPKFKELRDYQSAAIDRLRVSLASGRKRPVLMVPTGAGKTMIASSIIRSARAKGKRVAFCVPTLSLIDQTIEAFSAEGVREIGVMQAQHVMTDGEQPVQVCSVQTIERRTFPNVDLVVVDEAHRLYKTISRWMEEKPALPFIGLSATPWARGMGKLYDDLIIVATTQQLIERGYLSDFRVFAPSHPDLSQVKITAGDYNEGQLGRVMNTKELVGDVVETWIKLGENRPTIVFAVDCAHAQSLQSQFVAAGIPCGYQDAQTTDGERAIIRDHFHDGRLKVVTNVGMLTTGVDWDVRCIVLARPTKSEMLFVQMIGRGLRTAAGKTDCRIIDHSNTHTELGFVTDIHHTELNDGLPPSAAQKKKAQEKKPPTPTECVKCKALRPRGVHICPHCGFAPVRQTTIEPAAGVLEELRPKIKGKLIADKTITLRGREISLGEFFGALKQHAKDRGYKAQWAAVKYHEAVGTWPRYLEHQAPCDIPPEVASWIKSGQIRWARSKYNSRNQAHGR